VSVVMLFVGMLNVIMLSVMSTNRHL
jgi:hypothetical protein